MRSPSPLKPISFLFAAAMISAWAASPAAGSERDPAPPVTEAKEEAAPTPEAKEETVPAAEDDAASVAELSADEEEEFFDEAERQHELLFKETRYPSAATCGTCHPKHYKEWSVSQHSYAQLSPVYMAINNFLNFSTSSSMGDFCLRCHNQVGANLGESPIELLVLKFRKLLIAM